MEIAYEEIDGMRYAVWTAQNEPFGTKDAMAWSELVPILLGIGLFWFALSASIMLAAAGAWAFSFALTMIVGTVVALTAGLIRWAFRKRRLIARRRFDVWIAREPDAAGTPCLMVLQSPFGALADYGLLTVSGDQLLYHGPRYRAMFYRDDAVGCRFKPATKFRYRTPFGPRSAKLTMGGPSREGWVSKREAYETVESQQGSHEPADGEKTGEYSMPVKKSRSDPSAVPAVEGCSRLEQAREAPTMRPVTVYPPLRNPQIRFERGFLTKTVPLMLGAYVATFAFGMVPMEFLFRVAKHRSSASLGQLVGVSVAIIIFYTTVIACGYSVRAWMEAFNRKVDKLAAGATPSA